MTRTRPFPYLFLMSGLGEPPVQPAMGFVSHRSGPILSNVRATGQALLAGTATRVSSRDTSRNSRASPKAAHGDGLRARSLQTVRGSGRETADPMSPPAVRQN